MIVTYSLKNSLAKKGNNVNFQKSGTGNQDEGKLYNLCYTRVFAVAVCRLVAIVIVTKTTTLCL
jgi:hypothetical protein